MTIKNFTPGDILLITSKTKRGYETRMAQVTCINYNNNGLVTYCGKHSPDFQSTGSSAMAADFVKGKNIYLVIYPNEMFPDGAQVRYERGEKIVALKRLLDAMERHWISNGIK